MADKNNFRLSMILAFPIAFFGAFWLIANDYNNPPDAAFWLLSLLVLVVDLVVLYRYVRLQFNLISVGLIVSYLLITYGFVLNTKDHTLNFFMLLILLPFINLTLSGVELFASPLLRFLAVLFIDYIPGKIIGPVLELIGAIKASQSDELKQARQKKIAIAMKTVLVFALIGIPVIFIVLGLLSTANEQFADQIGKLFEDYLDLGMWLIRSILFLVIFAYMLGEFAFVKNFVSRRESISKVSMNISADSKRVFTYAILAVMTILNLFYLVFIVYELKYDFANVRDLLNVKNVDTYSELAVSRFWELICVAIINLVIVYFVLRPREELRSAAFKGAFWTNASLLFLNTLFMIASSWQRLNLYESGYGFTKKRFLAHSFLPVLICIAFLFFASLIWKKYELATKLSFVIVVLFFAIHIMLPSTYVVNAINLAMHKKGDIVVYDPSYLMEYSYIGYDFSYEYYDDSEQTHAINDVYDYDGLLLAQELVDSNDGWLKSADKQYLEYRLQNYAYKFKNNKQDWKHWREFNLMRYAVEQKLINN